MSRGGKLLSQFVGLGFLGIIFDSERMKLLLPEDKFNFS